MCEPLWRLTHKDATWVWSSEQEQAFERIKQAVTFVPVLKYFNPKQSSEGQAGTSSKGLGFVLLQNGQLVTYISRALTSAEQNYSQIEKKLLSQVYGSEHNHQYCIIIYHIISQLRLTFHPGTAVDTGIPGTSREIYSFIFLILVAKWSCGLIIKRLSQ